MAKEGSQQLVATTTPTKPVAPPINGIEMERIDYIPLKKQLNNVLKDKADMYWDTLKQFFTGRMTKRELDHFVLLYLTESHLKLHNAFIRALLQNSLYANTPPTQTLDPPKPIPKKKILTYQQPVQPAQSKDKEPSGKGHRSKDKKGRSSSSLSSADTAATTTTTSKSKKPKAPSSSSSSLSSSTSSRRVSKAGNNNTTTTETSLQTKEKRTHPKYSLLYSPEVQSLKDRMETIACESGLNGVSRQSVIYMMLALERHIKDILYNSNPQLTDKQDKHHYFYHTPIPTDFDDEDDYSSDDEFLPPNQRPPPQYLAYQYDSIRNELFNQKQEKEQQKRIDNHPTTSGLTLKSYNQQENEDIQLDNNNDETSTTNTTDQTNSNNNNNNNNNNNGDNDGEKQPDKMNIENNNNNNNTTNNNNETKMEIDSTKTIDTPNNNNNINNNNATTNTSTTTTTTTNVIEPNNNNNNNTQQQLLATKPNPNYFISKNPLLSFSIPVYKIPTDLFNNNICDEIDDDNTSGGEYSSTTTTKKKSNPILSTQDVYSTIEMNPYILGEDTLNFERINLNRTTQKA
ncbi:hypothetical protein DFA_12211 [Cavenderia fasciculata]|uniref:Transcriptional regulator n=1 Tax=Cavenderia fasciculata TaxID=261658 RepID=F4QCL1_CACFS|nr:uncharacterized protein DFA_12211 [Cavenderia fasciculata]EGG14439.1 hypothetical protein DFA_12211 [Cavenderia fasciculata]|eukprot:XP_004353848.1 hypothetical protein DFA_12211 [Cavenderia fasciculata]